MSTLRFDHTLPCPLTADALYARLTRALRDTDQTTFWPHDLNRVQLDALEPGARFMATYRVPVGPATQRPYLVGDVDPGRAFTYLPAPEHVFSGEVEVRVLERPEGAALRWRGAYEAPLWRPERAFFRYYFEPRFFGALAAALAALRPE